jgi:hypothetical protein
MGADRTVGLCKVKQICLGLEVLIMNLDNPKIKDIYVPLALISLAVILMIFNVIFPSNNASVGFLGGLLLIVFKTASFGVSILFCMAMCGWFGEPFTPFWQSSLQLLCVAVFTGAINGILGVILGDGIALYISLVPFLALMGYFFSDDAIQALLGIILLFSCHYVVSFALLPFLTGLIN